VTPLLPDPEFRSKDLTFHALILQSNVFSVCVCVRGPFGLKICLLYPPALFDSVNDVTIARVLKRFGSEPALFGDQPLLCASCHVSSL
jgi:hypothetical protein